MKMILFMIILCFNLKRIVGFHEEKDVRISYRKHTNFKYFF